MLFVPVGAATVQCVLWINLLAAEGGTSLFHDRNHIGVPDSGRCGSKPDLVAEAEGKVRPYGEAAGVHCGYYGAARCFTAFTGAGHAAPNWIVHFFPTSSAGS